MTDKSLCDSCTNIGCEFQSGIVRTKCAFYMPPQLEPDNCGNYVVQDSTTKNDLAVEKTDMIDKSNFSQEQYKTDLQSAYDSGYEQAKNDLEVDWESYKDVDGNSLDDLILEVLQNNFDCGNTYGYKVADEIIGLLPSVTPQESILDKIRAEIAEYGSIMVTYAITKNTKTDKGIEKLVRDVLKQAKKQVLAMIDKYKAESEGEDGEID